MATAFDESRVAWVRLFSRVAAIVGGLFGVLGIFLLYWYIYEAFSDVPTRLQWWAITSIVLSILFILGYAIAVDMVRSIEREDRRRIHEK